MATAILLFSISYYAACCLTFLPSGAVPLSEIQALTSFKLALHDPLGALNGWDVSTPLAPCDWRGIVCYSNRVRELRLPRLQLGGNITPQLASLRQLRTLSLHSNYFNGSIPPLSQCSLLRAVYFQNNSLSGSLPSSIVNLTNIRVLNVAHNFLSGSIPTDISYSIEFFDASSNFFSGEIPGNFSSKSQVQLINLSLNNFSGEIPASIGQLQELKYLWLDGNKLYSTLPSALANCSSLINFSAEDNMLRGLIPATIGSIPKLEVLSLSRNGLSGSIPASIFCSVFGHDNVFSLRIVQLGFNELTDVDKNEIGRCNSVLELLDVHENRIHGVLPSRLTNLTSLRFIDLSGNLLFGSLPSGIGKLTRLEELRVSNNSLTGEIPSDVVKCSELRVLDLEGNAFMGEIPVFLSELKNLKMLTLGGNKFGGEIPKSFGGLFQLHTLTLNNNNLTGNVPEELLKLNNLSTLNLGYNKLSGEIPYIIGETKGLMVLNLSGCGFSGRIPASIGSLLELKILDLSKQNLSGELPIELFGLPSLQVVALQENNLSGSVPEGFSSVLGLQYLNLSSNSFTGVIPPTFGFLSSLVVLSLAWNQISGMFPSQLGNCSSLEVLELRSNHFKGNIPDDITRLHHLKTLDFSRNDLIGKIPKDIHKCSSLISLRLDGNQLSGHIPDSFSRLSNLAVLNLSSNNLSGVIPVDISRLSGLRYLNLSSNNLEGEIPQLLGFRFNDISVFAMNGDLCGKPLGRDCANVRNRRRKLLFLVIGVSVAGAFIILFCCCGYIYSLLRCRNRLREGATGEKKQGPPQASSGAERDRESGENGGPKLVMFNNKITYAETMEATRQFDEDNVLSRGRYGPVFKASYQDGMVLSVRRLSDALSVDEGTFRKEAESLGKAKHRNLTVLRGYYTGPPPDARLLVYDYMPNGNLATLLQEASRQDGHVLNWPMRHLIARGIARGLAFLHSVSMVHGDIKPQNVLFDADFEAHLSELGLEKFTLATPSEASTSSAALTGQLTKEADVYSFGIVLLEILTGKKPAMFTQDEDIVKWVKRQLQRGQISELLEPGLLELDPESSEWEEFLLGVKVGLLCTAPDPLDRPSMADVVFMLEGCRVGPDIPSSADPTALPSPI